MMEEFCSVCEEKNGERKFRLPHPNFRDYRFNKWLKFINNPKYDTMSKKDLYETVRVCALHFDERNFCTNLPNATLKYNAVPTIKIKTEPFDDGKLDFPANGIEVTDKKFQINEEIEIKLDDEETIIDLPQPRRVALSKNNLQVEELAESSNSEPANASAKDVEFVLTSRNLSKICRTCLKEKKDVVNLFEKKYRNLFFGEILEICSVVKLKEDSNLSQYICLSCSTELFQAYSFREKCSKSESILKKFKKELAAKRNEVPPNLALRFHDYETTVDKNNTSDFKHLLFPDISVLDSIEAKLDRSIKKQIYNETLIDPVTVEKLLNQCKLLPSSEILRPVSSFVDGKVFSPNYKLPQLPLKPRKPRKKRIRKGKNPRPIMRKLILPGQCHVCNEPFATLKEYTAHASATKHYLNGIDCKICGKIFSKKVLLDAHTDRKHEKKTKVICHECGKCFTSRTYLFYHLEMHKQKKYVCKVCGATYFSLREITQHKKLNHEPEKNYCCEYCGEFFTILSTLKQHTEMKHRNVRNEICHICGKAYRYKHQLKKHVNTTHLKQHINCELCSKSFTREFAYLNHIKTQHPGSDRKTTEEMEMRLVECIDCNLKCRNKQLYSVHVKKDHEGSVCIYCDKNFEAVDKLKAHGEECHKDIKDFSCRYCGKCFPGCEELFTHLDTHKKRAYKCSKCSKAYRHSNGLRLHMAKHSQKKNFECQFCERTFLYGSSLAVHERVHTREKPYICDICGKGCMCSSSYKRHRNTHILNPSVGNIKPSSNHIPNPNKEIKEVIL